MKALEKRGAFCFKVHGGPWMMSGLPDIICCFRGQYVALETKMPEGAGPTDIQKLVHGMIDRAGGEVHVVRSVKQAENILDELAKCLDEG